MKKLKLCYDCELKKECTSLCSDAMEYEVNECNLEEDVKLVIHTKKDNSSKKNHPWGTFSKKDY